MTGEIKEVLRDFKDYQVPPEEGKPEDWERLIGRDIKINKGDTWGGGKGKW